MNWMTQAAYSDGEWEVCQNCI